MNPENTQIQKNISVQDLVNELVCMDEYAKDYPIRIELAYAMDDNLLFGQRIYRPDAKLWLHRDLSNIVLNAAQAVYQDHGYTLILYDGLRTVDAQSAMLKTKRVQDNPHWLEEPRLLSPPGAGAHPRGMAIDVSIMDEAGNMLDMGTDFDFLADNPAASHNPAHREYTHDDSIQKNRACLNDAMLNAAQLLNTALMPLPQEWWDFRLPSDVYERYPALRDADLPKDMQMMNMG